MIYGNDPLHCHCCVDIVWRWWCYWSLPFILMPTHAIIEGGDDYIYYDDAPMSTLHYILNTYLPFLRLLLLFDHLNPHYDDLTVLHYHWWYDDLTLFMPLLNHCWPYCIHCVTCVFSAAVCDIPLYYTPPDWWTRCILLQCGTINLTDIVTFPTTRVFGPLILNFIIILLLLYNIIPIIPFVEYPCLLSFCYSRTLFHYSSFCRTTYAFFFILPFFYSIPDSYSFCVLHSHSVDCCSSTTILPCHYRRCAVRCWLVTVVPAVTLPFILDIIPHTTVAATAIRVFYMLVMLLRSTIYLFYYYTFT